MAKIHVVTDSGSDLPADVRSKLNIHVIPLTIQFDEEIYYDGVDLLPDQFYSLLRKKRNMPSSCQPSPADFLRLYEKIAEPGDCIISVHLSTKMSGTYQSAVLAGTMLDKAIKVVVIDSKSASTGIGMVAIAVAEAVQKGASVEEATAAAQHVIDQLRVYFIVDTLEYLQKNGRIGRASALLGTLLNIKPVLTLDDGVVAPFEKLRGKSKALKRIVEVVKELRDENPDKRFRVAFSHSISLGETKQFAQEITDLLPVEGQVVVGQIGSTIGTHAGPGTVAVFIYPAP